MHKKQQPLPQVQLIQPAKHRLPDECYHASDNSAFHGQQLSLRSPHYRSLLHSTSHGPTSSQQYQYSLHPDWQKFLLQPLQYKLFYHLLTFRPSPGQRPHIHDRFQNHYIHLHAVFLHKQYWDNHENQLQYFLVVRQTYLSQISVK